jgi:hypothetical protein
MEWVELEWVDNGARSPERGDYIALVGEKSVGRVSSKKTMMFGKRWHWFLWWPAVPNSGSTRSRREAFLEVERRYNVYLQAGETLAARRQRVNGRQ